MATVQNPITGRSKGKFANAIFSKWKGRNTLRSKPLEVANPQSPAQTQQRDAFAAAMEFARTISSLIYIGFASAKDTVSEYNAFMSEAFKGWVDKTPTPPAFDFDWGLLTIAKGAIAGTPISAINATNGSPTVTVDYPTTILGAGQSVSDLAYCLVYNETQNTWDFSLGTADRADGSITVTMAENQVTGDTIYAYLFFKQVDGTEVSDSIAATTTV